MNLINRFKSLTIWNKLGVISGLASILGIPLAIFLYWLPQTNSLTATRIAAVTNLKSDLEKVKTLLPFDQAFSDCLKKRQEPFLKAVEACARERKVRGEDVQQIINKELAILRLNFSEKKLENINKKLNAVKFFAYEMWNNQLTLENWWLRGCPSEVAILSPKEGADYLSKHKGKPICAITVEKYENFFERDAKNENLIDATREATISADNLNSIVAPGTQTTIDKFFHARNNKMYGAMTHEIDSLTPDLKALIE